MKMTKLLVVILSLLTVLAASGCVASNKQIIQAEFHTEYPIYSSIKVIKQEKGPSGGSRFLTVQATIEAYPAPVICEGRITYLYNGRSFQEMHWSTLS